MSEMNDRIANLFTSPLEHVCRFSRYDVKIICRCCSKYIETRTSF